MQAVSRMEVIFLLIENKLPLKNPGICGGDISKTEVHYMLYQKHVKDMNFQSKDFQTSLSN